MLENPWAHLEAGLPGGTGQQQRQGRGRQAGEAGFPAAEGGAAAPAGLLSEEGSADRPWH